MSNHGQFDESKHNRSGDGKFTHRARPEAEESADDLGIVAPGAEAGVEEVESFAVGQHDIIIESEADFSNVYSEDRTGKTGEVTSYSDLEQAELAAQDMADYLRAEDEENVGPDSFGLNAAASTPAAREPASEVQRRGSKSEQR